MEAHEGQWKAQDAWCLSIHGTEIRLVTAHFSEMYLKMVNGVMMRPSEKLLVFRSQPLNLKYDHERPLAVKAIMALLKWLKSGQSQQALFKSGPGWQISKAICCSFYMKHREKMRNL